jgi:muramoyltetrapeptide carboxypeptidase
VTGNAREPRVWPPPLSPGSVVRVVAPAGPVNAEWLATGAEIIAGLGLTVRVGDHVQTISDRLPYLAAEDAVRAADFTAAWTDPATAAVWAARGGYGSQRMLDHLDWSALRAAGPRHLIGFSDVTALHGRFGRELDQVTVHGPGVTALSQLRDGPTAESLRRLLLTSPSPGAVLAEGSVLVRGRAEGRLWGGNLSLLASDVGVEPAPADDVVLVVEEVAEPAYRIDRLLTQLLRSGTLNRVRGVLVGDLGAAPSDGLPPLVADRLGDLGVPVVVDIPVGHGDRNLALPLGARVRLDAMGATGTLALDHAG